MIYTIPVYNDKVARWTSKFDLGDRRFTLYFSWNTIGEYWEFSILNDNEELLVGGIRLVTKIDLLDEYRAKVAGLPEGELKLLQVRDKVKLDRNNLGTDFVILYKEGELE